jgi:hypothetical protein
MARPVDELRAVLAADEPDYAAIVQTLDASDADGLREVAQGEDTSLAVKAVYLASLLPQDAGADIVANAAGHGRSLLRVTAATAVRNLSAESSAPVLAGLLADGDAGVRKTALASVPSADHPTVRASLQHMADNDDVQSLADRARELTGGSA